MTLELTILISEAVIVYFLVLGAHALRHRFGLAHYYALIGGLTAIMSWVTDAGVTVQVGGVAFMVGSTVFYTSLLLGVFVVYVFDGPRATRVAISTVMGVSIMVPLIAMALNLQMSLSGAPALGYVPTPSLRINSASLFATFMDLIFLAIAWEYMNNRFQRVPLGIRAFFTLLGVMWLDVVLFATGAFAGTPPYLAIMEGTAVSRLIVSCFAAPILWAYLAWQNRRWHAEMTQRPVLAILKEFAEIKKELSLAQQEIERRKEAEQALKESQEQLRALSVTDELTGLANRRYFWEMGQKEFQRAARYGSHFSLVLMDLDNFKEVNDTLGHDAGDQALKKVAQIGLARIRAVDLLARVGGEEFALLLPETDLQMAQQAAERIRQGIAEEIIAVGRGAVRVTASFGVATASPEATSLDGLYNRADQALYLAKNSGRNQVRLASA
ncbi:MAG: diguanylate cyclase [Thermodesulfobacteriota bacterium]